MEPRMTTSIFTEGLTYFWGTAHTMANVMKTRDIYGQDEQAMEDCYLMFLRKSNYFDSVQGVFLSNYFLNHTEDLGPFGEFWLKNIRRAIWWGDTLGFLNSIIEMSYSMQILLQWSDSYNLGFCLGKLVKIVYQTYMRGTFWRENTLKE